MVPSLCIKKILKEYKLDEVFTRIVKRSKIEFDFVLQKINYNKVKISEKSLRESLNKMQVSLIEKPKRSEFQHRQSINVLQATNISSLPVDVITTSSSLSRLSSTKANKSS